MMGDDDDFEMLEESAHSSRRWMDLEAAELHAARARVERLKRRSVSSSPPRERRRPGDPSDGDAPPGLGGETWFRRRASNAADDEDDAFPSHASSDLRRRGDIPGPPLVGKVTARSYEVDRRGETRDAARRERERSATRPRPPGEAHALRPTVTATSRVIEPAPPSFLPREELVPVAPAPTRAEQPVEAAPAKPTTPPRGEKAPPSPRRARPPPTPFRARSEGVTFVWSGSGSGSTEPTPIERGDESTESTDATRAEPDSEETNGRDARRGRTRGERKRDDENKNEAAATKTRRASPSPAFARRWGAGAAAAFGSGALRLRGGALALRRSVGTAANATKSAAARVAGSTKAAAACAKASAWRGAGAAFARGAASVRDTLTFVKEAAHAEEVLGGLQSAFATTKTFLLDNPDVTWNPRVPPLVAVRLGTPRGLGWFKILEGDQLIDARGPGDAPSVRAEATPRRSRLEDRPETGPGVTVVACGGRVFSADFSLPSFLSFLVDAAAEDSDDDYDDDETTRRALFENFEGYGSLGADFAATAAAAAAAVAADAERLERALRDADWTAPLSPLPPRGDSTAGTEPRGSRENAVVFHPALTPKAKVDKRKLRVEDYEESLATRVRTLQRMFPEVASEIAGAVYAFQEDVAARRLQNASDLQKSAKARVKKTLAAKGMTRVPVDVQAATRVVEELEAASVSVLMHGKVPTGESMRAWLEELKQGRGVGREAWENEHGAFFGPGASPAGSLSGSESYGDVTYASAKGTSTEPSFLRDAKVKATPRSRAATSRLAGAFAGWTGRAADDDAFLAGSDDADDAKAATHRLGFFFRAWREVSSTGPIRKATLDTVHRMRADASAEARSAKAAPIGKRALADVTNENGKTTFTSEKKKPSPPRRFFNLVASPFARRRRHPDSPHSDWGSSGSDFESEGVSTAAAARRSRGAASRDDASPGSDSSDVWMSAGAATSTPGSVASGAVASRPPVSPRFESARSRGARASATPTVYFPSSPSSEDSFSASASAARAAPAPASPATPGSLSSEVSEVASLSSPGVLDRVADAFVLDDAKSPGPMGPVLRSDKSKSKSKSKTGSTVYTLSPTSPLVGPRRGDSTSSEGSPSEESEGGREFIDSRKRSSPPGSRANKHAAAAAVGAPAGFVTAARAAFEREAAANTFDSPNPARGSRVRR
jgi:hypothetical protein